MNTMRHPVCLIAAALSLFVSSTAIPAADNEQVDPVKSQLDRMARDLMEIRNTMKTLEGLQPGLLQMGDRLKTAEDEIANLREDLLKLEARVIQAEQRIQGTSERIARSLDLSQQQQQQQLPQTATVRVVNRSGIRASLFLNDGAYSLEPFQTLNIPGVQPGQVTYQVLVDGYGTIRTRTTTLQSGETRTLTINPPQVGIVGLP